jgi:hypothetical protein
MVIFDHAFFIPARLSTFSRVFKYLKTLKTIQPNAKNSNSFVFG